MKRKNTSAQLLDNQFKNIYQNFKNFLDNNLEGKKFVIGVSGGPDSLALSCLSKLYSEETQKYFECIIIDHGVRKTVIKKQKKSNNCFLKKK